MSRFGKSSSKKRRDNRSGSNKSNNRSAPPRGGDGSSSGSQNGSDRQAGAPRPGKSRTGHGEGHGHRRKGPGDQKRPHFRPFTPRGSPGESGEQRKPEVSQQSIEKSRDSIRTWLNAGAELREKNLNSNKQKPDPKTLTLDPWQQQVFDLLRSGESVVVDAPTTAGKTRAVEVFFAMNIDDPTFRAADRKSVV